MIDLVDMRIKLKSKRSNNNVAKSSKSLYYQRSKTEALKNLQKKLVITNNEMDDFNISFT